MANSVDETTNPRAEMQTQLENAQAQQQANNQQQPEGSWRGVDPGFRIPNENQSQTPKQEPGNAPNILDSATGKPIAGANDGQAQGGQAQGGAGGSSTSSNVSSASSTVSRIVNGVDMSEQIGQANEAWNQALQNYMQQANGILGNYQTTSQAGLDQYQGNAQAIIDQLRNMTGQQLADYAANTGQTIDQATNKINEILAGLQNNLQPVSAGRVDNVGTAEREALLDQLTQAQQQQESGQVDYAVQQGVNELQRAEEDAQSQFQAQRDQIAGQERTARDNQALYSEMRGDRGGVGQAQYDAIANAAAQNQLTVNKQQTKLSTDTARQIADLRAQGEFEKADKLLEISQGYLSQLMQLKQWADEANIGIDEFNIGVEQWEQEYNAKIQQLLGEMGINATQYATGLNLDRQQYLTGQGLNAANLNAQQQLSLQSDVNQQRQQLNDALAQYGLNNAQYMSQADINRLTSILSAYQQNAANMASTEMQASNIFGSSSDGTQTFEAAEAQRQRDAQNALQMIGVGVKPTDEQLAALGWTEDQYKSYKKYIKKVKSSGGGRGSSWNLNKEVTGMLQAGKTKQEILTFLGGMDRGTQTDREKQEVQREIDRINGLEDW